MAPAKPKERKFAMKRHGQTKEQVIRGVERARETFNEEYPSLARGGWFSRLMRIRGSFSVKRKTRPGTQLERYNAELTFWKDALEIVQGRRASRLVKEHIESLERIIAGEEADADRNK